VVTLNEIPKDAKIQYPCRWTYKIVVISNQKIESIIKSVIGQREFKVTTSKKSKKGKYTSYNLDLLVHNDDDRKTLYEEFKKIDTVKIVL